MAKWNSRRNCGDIRYRDRGQAAKEQLAERPGSGAGMASKGAAGNSPQCRLFRRIEVIAFRAKKEERIMKPEHYEEPCLNLEQDVQSEPGRFEPAAIQADPGLVEDRRQTRRCPTEHRELLESPFRTSADLG